MIPKACKYGTKVAIFVASRAETGVMTVKEIEAFRAFKAKILQVLNKHWIIRSL